MDTLEGVHPGLRRDLQPQGLEHLGNDQRGPELLVDDDRLGRPQEAQLEGAA